MKNLQASRDDQGDAYTRIKMVARSGNNPSLAICHANGKPSLQLNAALVAHRQTKSKQNLRELSCRPKPKTLETVWMSNIRTQGGAPTDNGNTHKMGCQDSSRHLPWAVPDPQQKCGLGLNIHTGYVSLQFHVKFR